MLYSQHSQTKLINHYPVCAQLIGVHSTHIVYKCAGYYCLPKCFILMMSCHLQAATKGAGETNSTQAKDEATAAQSGPAPQGADRHTDAVSTSLMQLHVLVQRLRFVNGCNN